MLTAIILVSLEGMSFHLGPSPQTFAVMRELSRTLNSGVCDLVVVNAMSMEKKPDLSVKISHLAEDLLVVADLGRTRYARPPGDDVALPAKRRDLVVAPFGGRSMSKKHARSEVLGEIRRKPKYHRKMHKR